MLTCANAETAAVGMANTVNSALNFLNSDEGPAFEGTEGDVDCSNVTANKDSATHGTQGTTMMKNAAACREDFPKFNDGGNIDSSSDESCESSDAVTMMSKEFLSSVAATGTAKPCQVIVTRLNAEEISKVRSREKGECRSRNIDRPKGQCPVCQKLFHSATTLQNHIRSAHGPKSKATYAANLDFHREKKDGAGCAKFVVHDRPLQREVELSEAEPEFEVFAMDEEVAACEQTGEDSTFENMEAVTSIDSNEEPTEENARNSQSDNILKYGTGKNNQRCIGSEVGRKRGDLVMPATSSQEKVLACKKCLGLVFRQDTTARNHVRVQHPSYRHDASSLLHLVSVKFGHVASKPVVDSHVVE